MLTSWSVPHPAGPPRRLEHIHGLLRRPHVRPLRHDLHPRLHERLRLPARHLILRRTRQRHVHLLQQPPRPLSLVVVEPALELRGPQEAGERAALELEVLDGADVGGGEAAVGGDEGAVGVGEGEDCAAEFDDFEGGVLSSKEYISESGT